MKTDTKEPDHAREQGQAQYDSIREMVADLDVDDDKLDAIYEHPLTVLVRSGWYAPGAEVGKPQEFEILLCTGGPAVRLIGKLTADNHSCRTLPVNVRNAWIVELIASRIQSIISTRS